MYFTDWADLNVFLCTIVIITNMTGSDQWHNTVPLSYTFQWLREVCDWMEIMKSFWYHSMNCIADSSMQAIYDKRCACRTLNERCMLQCRPTKLYSTHSIDRTCNTKNYVLREIIFHFCTWYFDLFEHLIWIPLTICRPSLGSVLLKLQRPVTFSEKGMIAKVWMGMFLTMLWHLTYTYHLLHATGLFGVSNWDLGDEHLFLSQKPGEALMHFIKNGSLPFQISSQTVVVPRISF